MYKNIFTNELNVEMILKNWGDFKVWDEICLPYGYSCSTEELVTVHLHPTAKNAHVLFYTSFSTKRTELLIDFLTAGSLNISPEYMNFYIIDCQDSDLYQMTKEFPHFAGGITDADELGLGLYIIHRELMRRQKVLRRCGITNTYSYLRAYSKGEVNEPMPLLFITINELECFTKNTHYLTALLDLTAARQLGIHIITASVHPESIYLTQDKICLTDSTDKKLSSRCLYPDKGIIKLLLKKAIKRSGYPARSLSQDTVWEWEISSHSGENKKLLLVHGDLCKIRAEYDVVVCSAFKQDYIPTKSSFIGALNNMKGISVANLSCSPELDFRSQGCWLSEETGTDFHRIACVELLNYYEKYSDENSINIILKKSFSTLRFILEQAEFCGIPVTSVALPILGTGNQNIEISFVLGTLISQCQLILQSNNNVSKIVIFERDASKAQFAAQALNAALSKHNSSPEVFLSYSSKQAKLAKRIYNLLEQNHIPCWMAPDSIPAGASYLEEIPVAISQTKVFLLLLTPEVEQSKWVQKEIGTAIGANKIVIPYQPKAYTISESFRFLLDGEQIILNAFRQPDNAFPQLIERIKNILNIKGKIY